MVHSRQITIGEELPHLYAVTEGLDASERILLDGLRKVKNNDRIKVEVVSPAKALSELNALHAE